MYLFVFGGKKVVTGMINVVFALIKFAKAANWEKKNIMSAKRSWCVDEREIKFIQGIK